MASTFILSNMFRLSVISSSDSAHVHLHGFFRPWIFLLNFGPLCVMLRLSTMTFYRAGEFQALKLIVIVVFGAMD